MKKRGISLIVLVITIIVIIILAGSVVLSLSNNNPIEQAEEAKFKSNLQAYDAELSLALANEYLNDHAFDPNSFNKTEAETDAYLSSISDDDLGKFKIESGKLVYVGGDESKAQWANEVLSEASGSERVASDVNQTFTGETTGYAYDNPVIPAGFVAVDTASASWTNLSEDYNKGLVIEDENGNQFVWVPVDGTNITYEKWCMRGWTYEEVYEDGTSVASEFTQVNTNYHGFYVSRYEAGNEAGTLVSKKGATVWTNINYSTAQTNSEAMYTSDEVKSGLITGIQWDTIVKWAENSGKNVTDNRAWGNYSDSVDPSNVDNGSLQTAGHSENWKVNNIYDFAGNVEEWTNEIVAEGTGQYITRDTYYGGNGQYTSVSTRNGTSPSVTSDHLGFRVVLYVI